MREQNLTEIPQKYFDDAMVLDGDVIPPDTLMVVDCGRLPSGDSFVKVLGLDGFIICIDCISEG